MLLPELESPEVADAAVAIRAAIASISLADADVLVLLTPHASHPGIYREVRGHLGGFGVPQIAVTADTPAGLARSLGSSMLEGPVDHGVVVPLRLRSWGLPVVAVGVGDVTRLSFEGDERVAIIASLNGSAGISARAPLTAVPGADRAEERFAAALEEDIAIAARVELPGSCGGDVMAVFAELFGGRSAKVLAHETPVGVGYLVAEVR